MDLFDKLPQAVIQKKGKMTEKFLELGINDFQEACNYVHNLPYGYNIDKDNPMILFIENRGSCTTKHGVIAQLALELDVNLQKNVGVYKFTEDIVEGAQKIIDKYNIPYIPMVHCFLAYKEYRFDLTEGNFNGKKTSIENFIDTIEVIPFISRKEEYLWFRKIVDEQILPSSEMKGIELKTILQAREEAIKLLKENIKK